MSQDRELVEAVLAGRPGAFERLVREHQALCWHIVHRMVRDAEDARDICQEAFLRVHRYLRQYRYESSLKTWIGRIAYSTAARHLERRQLPLAAVAPDEDAPAPLDTVDSGFDLEAAWADRELVGRVREAIDALPPLLRTLVTLYHLEELSIPEIAQTTGLAPGTIKSHLFRSRVRLRAAIDTPTGVAV